MPPSDQSNTDGGSWDTVVVGAGVAGLTAARHLIDAGHSVLVVDKGRSVGGRLATRRIGDGTLDHGAQFFTVRGDAFRAVVDQAVDEDIVRVWNHGFSEGGDGHPRFVGTQGMNGFGKWLARDLPVQLSTQLRSIRSVNDGWQLTSDDDRVLTARQILLTPPVPQTLTLLDAGDTRLTTTQRAELDAVQYHPVLGLLAVLTAPSAVPDWGGLQLNDGPFSFIGDNRSKGISSAEAVTFHANHTLSREHFDAPDQANHQMLLELAQPWIGDVEVAASQLKRWRYAGPVETRPEAAYVLSDLPYPAVLAGDAFAGPKVEGAFNSGLAAAEVLLR